MTNDEEMEKEEKIAELIRLLEEGPVIEIGNPMRCDSCNIVVDHWIGGKDENGPFSKCPNCGNLVHLKQISKNIWIH